MKTCMFDGEQYLLTIPNESQFKAFENFQGLEDPDGLNRYETTRIFYQRQYTHTQGAQFNLMAKTKSGTEQFYAALRITGSEDPIHVLSKVQEVNRKLRPMLIPLDANGFVDPHVQGDCPNGTITVGGCITINEEPVQITSRHKLVRSDRISVVDTTDDERCTQSWMWWNGRLICCTCQLNAPAWFLIENGMVGDVW